MSTIIQLQEGLQELQRQVKKEKEQARVIRSTSPSFSDLDAQQVEELEWRINGRSMLHNEYTTDQNVLDHPERDYRTILFLMKNPYELSLPPDAIHRMKNMSINVLQRSMMEIERKRLLRIKHQGRRASNAV